MCPLPGAYNSFTPPKVCEKCCRSVDLRPHIENRCNLCKMVLSHVQKLQEHLVEHTFAGCEDRGFNCYICSAVFTAPGGLLNHMLEHGVNSKPYDCNLCPEKFYFRAEWDHYLVDHDLRESSSAAVKNEQDYMTKKDDNNSDSIKSEKPVSLSEVKKEVVDTDHNSNNAHEDEYIEVENLNESQTKQTALKSNLTHKTITCKGVATLSI